MCLWVFMIKNPFGLQKKYIYVISKFKDSRLFYRFGDVAKISMCTSDCYNGSVGEFPMRSSGKKTSLWTNDGRRTKSDQNSSRELKNCSSNG